MLSFRCEGVGREAREALEYTDRGCHGEDEETSKDIKKHWNIRLRFGMEISTDGVVDGTRGDNEGSASEPSKIAA